MAAAAAVAAVVAQPAVALAFATTEKVVVAVLAVMEGMAADQEPVAATVVEVAIQVVGWGMAVGWAEAMRSRSASPLR